MTSLEERLTAVIEKARLSRDLGPALAAGLIEQIKTALRAHEGSDEPLFSQTDAQGEPRVVVQEADNRRSSLTCRLGQSRRAHESLEGSDDFLLPDPNQNAI